MKDIDIIGILPVNTKKVLEYLGYVNDKSNPLHATIGAIYEQASRYLCWNRVYIDGMKGLEPASLYFMNFAKSGAYKDEVIRTIADVNKLPLEKQRDVKDSYIEHAEARYKDGLAKISNKDKDAKDDYKDNNKPVKWRNTYSGGTVQGMYIDRKGMADAGFGSLHFEHSELMDLFSRKDSNIKDILSILKDVFPKGNSKTESVLYQRRSNVDGVPMTMFLHGVSTGLKEDARLMQNLIYILESGMAKRSYVFFDTKHQRAELTIEELNYNAIEAALLRPDVEDIFMNAYEAVKLSGFNGIYKQYKTMPVGDDVKIKMNDYRNVCTRFARRAGNKVLEAEIIDRFWKALRLAACVALIEHPEELCIRVEDYEVAVMLTEHWGDQFQKFLKDKTQPLHDEAYEYIYNNPGVSKGEIRNVLGIGNNQNSTHNLDKLLIIVEEMANEKGLVLERKDGRGLAKYYSIIDAPYTDEEEYARNQKGLSSVDISKLNIN